MGVDPANSSTKEPVGFNKVEHFMSLGNDR